jgi:IS5 family transposase
MAFRVSDKSRDFFESLVVGRPQNKVLEAIDRMIDWSAIRKVLTPAYSKSKEGKPAYDPVVLVKMLLLEMLYDLSDVRVAQECADRLSFRAFIGIDLKSPVPDDTTLVRFRNRLRHQNLLEKVEGIIMKTIEEKGFSLKGGSIIDATLIPAAAGPRDPDKWKKKKEAEASEGTAEGDAANQESAKKAPESPPEQEKAEVEKREPSPRKEPDADFTVKRGKCVFGFKAHLSRDLASGLVKSFRVTPASVHDTNIFAELIAEGDPVVLADKGYCSEKNRDFLEEKGILDGIMKKDRVREHPLIKELNRKLTHLSPFAALKTFFRPC